MTTAGIWSTIAAVAAGVASIGVPATAGGEAGAPAGPRFADSARITNPYMPVSRFDTCRLTGLDEGVRLKVTRTLLDRTKEFRYQGQRVETAVVRDRVVGDGRLIELTRDFFAQSAGGTVYYFGERVNEYEPGKPVSHGGQWILGRDTRRPGVLMPAHPRVGDEFRSERVPGVTHEVDRIVASHRRAEVGGKNYRHVITVRETARPPLETEFKKYSRGAGVIAEANGGVHLIGCR